MPQPPQKQQPTQQVTVHQALEMALKLHQSGRLNEAEPIYRQILTREPNNVDALHLLGMIALQVGQHDAAIELIRRAIALNPRVPDYHNNLGMGYLGKAQHTAAVASFRTAMQLKPDYPQAHNNLGVALGALNQAPAAIDCYRSAVKLKPDYVEAWRNLADTLNSQGRFREAVDAYREALKCVPNDSRTLNDLANALRQLGKNDEAEATYRAAIEHMPNFAVPWNNLANLLKDNGHLEAAIDAYRKAIEISPDLAPLYNNLGNALAETGALDEAIECYRKVTTMTPEDAPLHGSLLLTLHYHPEFDPAMALEEHREWNRRHAEPLRKFILPHSNDRNPDRRLKIGYVSADFRDHPVGRFMLPLLYNHDRSQVEVFCYSGSPTDDALSDQARAATDVWRPTLTLNDEQLAETIRRDRIDILVDLAAHTAGSRMRVFARKPAPVEVSYLAYVGTTGVSAIDYRFTDPYLDPPGLNDQFYVEESVRLPQCYWCYQAPANVPEPNALPAASGGHVTFGSMNNFAKVSDSLLKTWTDLLNALPTAHMLIHAKAGSHRERVQKIFTVAGIAAERLGFINRLPVGEYFMQFHRFDVGLDTFPYGGGTTTCDALWMGVPVVSRFGQRAVSRAGLSILSNVGLPQLVVDSDERYIATAIELASDIPRLVETRATLRQQMSASPLMDGKRFARDVEAAFREMWKRWCAKPRT
jgi:predicted O-linked N-acetylglucosamine transferase (SPINDLY family)